MRHHRGHERRRAVAGGDAMLCALIGRERLFKFGHFWPLRQLAAAQDFDNSLLFFFPDEGFCDWDLHDGSFLIVALWEIPW